MCRVFIGATTLTQVVLCRAGNILVDVYLNWQNWFLFIILAVGLLVSPIDCMPFVFSPRCLCLC